MEDQKMENSIFAVKKKTKFDLPVAIITSVDALLVLIAAVLLSLTFIRLISPGHQVEIELDTLLKKDEKTTASCDTREKDAGSQDSGFKLSFSSASSRQRI
jgi:hypothetical protein